MKQNKYDDEHFYSAYEKMPRSVKGLEGAGGVAWDFDQNCRKVCRGLDTMLNKHAG